MDSGCAAGSGAGAGPVDRADADARVLGFFQWQEQRRRLVRDEQGWASMSVVSTGKSLAGRCWASTCSAGSMTRSRPKTSLFRPPVLLPRGNSFRLLPFLQVPSSNPMEAEYYQASASLLWPCTTRRRKREDDEEIEPPPQRVDPRNSEARHAEDRLKAVAHELGHEVQVFSSEKFAAVPSKLPGADQEEDDEFYELQPADYFNLISNRMTEQSKMLKTRKMGEAELAAQRAKRTKAVMRVRFPDGYILEADFLPSERIHSLVDLLMKVIARPDLPFYLYTVPPKKRIVDTSQDFYTVGFVPGANVYFSYDLVEGSTLNMDNVKSGSYLHEEIRSLNGLSLLAKPASQCDDSKMNSTAHQLNESQSDSVSYKE